MEYDLVLKQIGEFGKYQKRLILIAFFPVLFNAFSTPISIFFAGDQNFRCLSESIRTNDLIEDNNTTVNGSVWKVGDGTDDNCHVHINGSKQKCVDWEFDKSVFENTVISQFRLVCDYRTSNSHAIATYFFGSFCAPLMMTPLADIFGRRTIACISLTFVFIVNIIMPFCSSIYMFAICRFFDGFFGATMYTTTFVIGIELLSASNRVIAGTAILLVYCAGEFILVFLAYFIRDWRWLQLSVAIPMALPLLYWWPKVLPESVRWLISRGRIKDAIGILKRAARINGKSFPNDLQLKQQERIDTIIILKELIRSRKLILFWGVCIANWFVIAFIYYGIKINIGKLGGDIYVSFSLLILAEACGYVLLFFMDKIGHKRLHMIAMGSTCFACITSIFSILFASKAYRWLTVLLAMMGKLFVSTAYGMIYVYTGELFPTVTRTFAIGSCNFFAMTGSLISPYLYQLTDGKLQNVLPLILYSVIITFVTILTGFLPDTSKRKLPDHVKDAEKHGAASSDEKYATSFPSFSGEQECCQLHELT